MADNAEKNKPQGVNVAGDSKLGVENDDRLRYIGFDVGPSKIGELFKSGKEQQGFLDHVREKRERHDILRDTSNFREERISGFEKYILIAVMLFVLISTFLPVTPWISGYFETRTEITIGAGPKAVAGEPLAGEAGVAGAEVSADGSSADGSSVDGSSADGSATEAAVAPPQRKSGFQELQVKKTRTRIEKTPFKLSGAQLFARIGDFSSDIFSSSVVLIASGIFFMLFALLTFGVPIYIIYSVLTIKGGSDSAALKLKKVLKVGWYPVILWAAMLILSVAGANYGFDTTGALNQIGDSYGMPTFLGLIGSGFYVSLGGCMFAGVKSVEI